MSKVSLVSMVIVSSLSLHACGGGGTSTTTPPPPGRADSHHYGVTEFRVPRSKRHANVVNHKRNILHCLG